MARKHRPHARSGLSKVYLLWHVHHQAEEDGEVRRFTHPDNDR
ncbi:hypothetical protein [Streptomyces sp. NPDC002221]